MRIEQYHLTNQEELATNKWNMYLGLSLGNRKFSKKAIASYIHSSLEYTRSSLLLLIPDAIHAHNIQVRKGIVYQDALGIADQRGKEFRKVIESVLTQEQLQDDPRIKIAHWNDIEDAEYLRVHEILSHIYKTHISFYLAIQDIVKATVPVWGYSSQQRDTLGRYVVAELPTMLDGVRYNGELYNLYPYPGDTAVNRLVVAMRQGERFQDIMERLDVKNAVASLEAYPE